MPVSPEGGIWGYGSAGVAEAGPGRAAGTYSVVWLAVGAGTGAVAASISILYRRVHIDSRLTSLRGR